MLLPTPRVTLDRWSVRIGLAQYVDPFMTTLAVDSDFSITWRVRTWLLRMALSLALVPACVSELAAFLAAAICHEVFSASNALPGGVAYLLACVTAFKLCVADLATIVTRLVAEDVSHQLLGAVAEP